MMRYLFFKPGDLKIIGILFFVGMMLMIGWWVTGFSNTQDTQAQIFYQGKLLKTLSLQHSQEIKHPTYPPIRFFIDDGSIRFVSSDCKDQICIKTGSLDRAGQMAACLPNDTVVKIISRGERNAPGEWDTIVS